MHFRYYCFQSTVLKILGMGISRHIPIRFDSDSEVNGSILKQLLMHLEAFFFMYILMQDFQKYIYASEIAAQSLLSLPTFVMIIKEINRLITLSNILF